MATFLIKNANLLDGLLDDDGKMPLQKDMAVYVCDNVISKICKTSELEYRSESSDIPTGIQTFDLDGSYLLPGLVNNHIHLAGSGGAPKSSKPTDFKKLISTLKKIPGFKTFWIHSQKKRAMTELESGVTTIRVVGGIDDFDGQVRDAINAGKCAGPRVLTSNLAVSVPGGHFAGSLATESASADEARQDVRDIAKTNPDFIKVMVTGGVMDSTEEGEPGCLRMSPEIVRAVSDEAHKLGYKTVAHVESTEGVKVSLENGIDSIEHGAALTPELVDKFKETGAVVTATLSPVIPYVYFDESVSKSGDIARNNAKIVYEGMVDCYKKCLQYDIPIGLGTDTGCAFITNYNFWRELAYFCKNVECLPDLALNIATFQNAKMLGLDKKIGSIEVGKNAEMIVSNGNPLDNFANLSTLRYIFFNDTIIEYPHVKKMKNVDVELDKYM